MFNQIEKEPKKGKCIESFDSFFAGLSAKDEKRAIYLYGKYLIDFVETAREEARKEEREGFKILLHSVLRIPDIYLRNKLEGLIKNLK